MDANKLKKLREVSYQIGKSCYLCMHARFSPHREWGTCSFHWYEHLKHNASTREMSIHRAGVCPSFDWYEYRNLGAFEDFLLKDD